MFSSVGWGELLILLAAALIILGPERLPGAVSWTMGSLRKVRDYATGASSQLQDELGTDFDEIRKPLSQLNELRQMTPKSIVTKHLFDGDSSTIDDMGKSVRDTLDIRRIEPRRGARAEESTTSPALDRAQLATGPHLQKTRPDSGPTNPKHNVDDWDAT